MRKPAAEVLKGFRVWGVSFRAEDSGSWFRVLGSSEIYVHYGLAVEFWIWSILVHES